MTTTETEKPETRAQAELREILKPGETVYTILRHVSKSGMSRVIDLFVMRDNEPRRITWSVCQALGYAYDRKHEGLHVSGYSMDMGFHVVYSLARALWNDAPSRVKAKGGSNDAGYLLEQRWM